MENLLEALQPAVEQILEEVIANYDATRVHTTGSTRELFGIEQYDKGFYILAAKWIQYSMDGTPPFVVEVDINKLAEWQRVKGLNWDDEKIRRVKGNIETQGSMQYRAKKTRNITRETYDLPLEATITEFLINERKTKKRR